ncbi:ISAs1 family transposase [Trichormus azollae HNT15244]
MYGCTKYEWLKTFLELPNGRLSQDRFTRVFAQLNTQQFQSCFLNWMKTVQRLYGCTKYEWLKTFLELPNGRLSQDRFTRVFAQLNTQQFQSCFLNWMKTVQSRTEGEVVAIDRKTLCGSHDQSIKQSPLQIVSAWATTNKLLL